MAPTSMPTEERLREVAQIMAHGILRARLRRHSKRKTAPVYPENLLEVSASSSAHASNPSREGERR